jgi:hypothetical protein
MIPNIYKQIEFKNKAMIKLSITDPNSRENEILQNKELKVFQDYT